MRARECRPGALNTLMTAHLRIEAEKQSMREEARARRRAISPDARREAALAVAERGLGFAGLSPGAVGIYYPVRSEFDSLPLLRRAASEGWMIALPVVTGEGPLGFRAWREGAALKEGAFGIPEPAAGEILRPWVLVVPLLAFDRRCRRLGYGGGHYDRTLAALRSDGPLCAIGLAFDEQQVEEVPAGPQDEVLDWVLTPSGPIRR